MAENINFPCSYLHNEGNGLYQLLVSVDVGKLYKISPPIYNEKDSEWSIVFDEVAIAGRVPAASYPLRMKPNDLVKIITLPIGGSNSRPSDQNVCKIYSDDCPNTQGQFPVDKKYLPHIYLVRKKDDLTRCTLHLRIYSPNRTAFLIGDVLKEGKDRIINVKEQSTGTWNEAIWTGNPKDYDILLNEGNTIVQVFDNTNSVIPVAKGTIRHSAADNKPFDLLRCEDFEN